MCKHAVNVFRMINCDVLGYDIIGYASTLRDTIVGGYDTRGLDAFKGSRTSEAERPKKLLGVS